jgi:NAD(P)-dependent dehydrogenase (short-subunit alcohol dehydrogenase family)
VDGTLKLQAIPAIAPLSERLQLNKLIKKTLPGYLITGASSGFGEEFARQYAKQGHSFVLVARRLDRHQTIAETLRQQYRIDVVVEQVDLSDVEAVIQMMQRLRTRGIAIDILINNAGHGVQGPFGDSKLDASLAMLQLEREPDCRHACLCTGHADPTTREDPAGRESSGLPGRGELRR